MKEELLKYLTPVRDFLNEIYKACEDMCGEDDDVNTIPAKNALSDVTKAIEIIEKMG